MVVPHEGELDYDRLPKDPEGFIRALEASNVTRTKYKKEREDDPKSPVKVTTKTSARPVLKGVVEKLILKLEEMNIPID